MKGPNRMKIGMMKTSATMTNAKASNTSNMSTNALQISWITTTSRSQRQGATA